MAFIWMALPFPAQKAGAFVQRPFERKMLQKVCPLGMLRASLRGALDSIPVLGALVGSNGVGWVILARAVGRVVAF
jgi:hypothetical protein